MEQRYIHTFQDALSFVLDASDRSALRNFNFMNSGQPPSVGKLLTELGFEVEFVELPNSVSGYLEHEPFAEKGWKVVINKSHSRVRQRFTALHELAHFYLHPHRLDPLEAPAHRADIDGIEHFYSTQSEIVEEREANAWVEALVFGQRALAAAKQLYGSDLRAIARKFGFSEEVVRIALNKR